MPKYQGHKNWNHWNVSLWIDNEYPLYQAKLEAIRQARTLDEAATLLCYALRAALWERGTPAQTPDGAPLSISSIRGSMSREDPHTGAKGRLGVACFAKQTADQWALAHEARQED